MAVKRVEILYECDDKQGVIKYRNPDKRRRLPEYRLDSVVVDGVEVSITMIDGTVRYLPPCKKGYKLKSNDRYDIVLEKE